jgi:uncharacterized membrane protein
MQRTLAHAALAAALAVSLAPAASLAAQPKEQNGVSYINGGVGTTSRTPCAPCAPTTTCS